MGCTHRESTTIFSLSPYPPPDSPLKPHLPAEVVTARLTPSTKYGSTTTLPPSPARHPFAHITEGMAVRRAEDQASQVLMQVRAADAARTDVDLHYPRPQLFPELGGLLLRVKVRVRRAISGLREVPSSGVHAQLFPGLWPPKHRNVTGNDFFRTNGTGTRRIGLTPWRRRTTTAPVSSSL
jgi:hypothetical protein